MLDRRSWDLYEKTGDDKVLRIMVVYTSGNLSIDIPKGEIDRRETIMNCAYRETWEETRIGRHDIEIVPIILRHGLLTILVGITTKTPMFFENPKTGTIEHEGWGWLTIDEFVHGAPGYLKPLGEILREQLREL